MRPENARANAQAELARAAEALGAAEMLLRGGFLNDAVSRAYYASFHAARALLVSLGHQPRSHRGALHLFNLHFVRTGKLDPRFLSALARAQYDRTTADYTASPRFDLKEAEEEVAGARELIAAAKALLAA